MPINLLITEGISLLPNLPQMGFEMIHAGNGIGGKSLQTLSLDDLIPVLLRSDPYDLNQGSLTIGEA